ncbi:MAG: hypothetical protein K2N89_08550, partial [Lachnospiraceae bacterium]|nr:hypothetical protein [Lachnospiraceae bacterium]
GYDSADGVYKVKDSEDSSRKGKPIAANVAVSNNVNKGTATILITGGKNKDTDKNATSVKKTFKITAIDLNEADVKVGQIAPVEYAVNGAVPTGINVTIKSDGKVFTLKQGKDYTVKYGNNKKVTTGQEKKATVTITGKGNFAKKYNKEKVEYEITPLKLSDLKVNAVTACEGMKPGKVKATVVDKNGAALKASQYVVKVYAAGTGDALCENALTSTDTIYVAVEAKENEKNLTGATEREPFKVGKDFSKAKIVLKKGEDGKVITKDYTGSAINLTAGEITVSYRGETENLKPGEDYEIAECINNVNKGTATAIVKGIGDYSGTKTVKFKIVGKNMTIDRWTAWEDFKSFLNGLTKQTK